MFEVINRLALNIESAWELTGYSDEAFSYIAAQFIDQPLELDFDILVRRILQGGSMPAQRRIDQGFGQPSISLYSGERFLIEALCWHSGTPAIHHHAFTGAFRVLTGQSVHSRYVFTENYQVGGVTFGALELETVELLDRNSTTRIPRGAGLIHSAFHLESPSMTIVARTHQSPEPELTYLPPGIAYDSAARSIDLHKRLQILDTLNQTRCEVYPECVRTAIDASDFYDGMQIVLRTSGHQVNDADFIDFAERLSRKHGPETSLIIPALIEERRRSELQRMRTSLTDPDVRFLLASLLSFSSREYIVYAMTQRYGCHARERLLDGVATLLGGDDNQRIVVRTAVDALLDDELVVSFPDRASRAWACTLTASESQILETFYANLLDNPVLAPLCMSCSGDGKKA